MSLSHQQETDLWNLIQHGIASAGVLSFVVPSILSGIDKRIPKIPPSLSDARVGDVLDAYASWRSSGKL